MAKKIFELFRQTFKEWQEDKAPRLAAALAYYTVFSLAPLLIIVIAVAGLVFGQEAVEGEIVEQIDGMVGAEGAEVIQTSIQNARSTSKSTLAAAIGVVTLLFGAAGVFGQLHDALNTVWEVTPKPGRGLLGTIEDRFLSMTMVLGIGFLLMVSLVVSAGIGAVDKFARDVLPSVEILLQILSFIISYGIITLLFAMMFKILPDVEIRWKDVWVGAVFTALLFNLGKLAIGLYLGNSSTASTYGTAASFVVLLLWIYYSAQIFLFGAEFTQVYTQRYGSRMKPDEDAIALTEEARAQQGIPTRQQLKQAAGTPPAAPVKGVNPGAVVVSMLVGIVVGKVLKSDKSEG